MTSRIAFVAAVLLSAGVARASVSSVPASEEKILETGAPISSTATCSPSQESLTAALLQVPDQERGTVMAASCDVKAVWPTAVDARDRR